MSIMCRIWFSHISVSMPVFYLSLLCLCLSVWIFDLSLSVCLPYLSVSCVSLYLFPFVSLYVYLFLAQPPRYYLFFGVVSSSSTNDDPLSPLGMRIQSPGSPSSSRFAAAAPRQTGPYISPYCCSSYGS